MPIIFKKVNLKMATKIARRKIDAMEASAVFSNDYYFQLLLGERVTLLRQGRPIRIDDNGKEI